jgi:hypothetical protein
MVKTLLLTSACLSISVCSLLLNVQASAKAALELLNVQTGAKAALEPSTVSPGICSRRSNSTIGAFRPDPGRPTIISVQLRIKQASGTPSSTWRYTIRFSPPGAGFTRSVVSRGRPPIAFVSATIRGGSAFGNSQNVIFEARNGRTREVCRGSTPIS